MKSFVESILNREGEFYWNLNRDQLIEKTLINDQGKLSSTGALAINTGEFTGRSPQDRFIVKDSITSSTVHWGEINKPFDSDKFDGLYNKVLAHVEGKKLYVKDVGAGADEKYQLKVRIVTEYPWQSLFVDNMFVNVQENYSSEFEEDWQVISIPSFMADAQKDGTRQHNFAVVNFSRKTILIGGTAYTGEIKKGVFSVLNYLLPTQHNVLPMHCSVNEGDGGSSTVFFGLSGTGKTTLSANPERALVGDDEHGWSDEDVFNFEGGCYAKAIDLSVENEPEIYKAIKYGALLENIVFKKGTREVDFSDDSITVNTRVSYPLSHIENCKTPPVAGLPKNIFFLTCDAYGVFPPISKLSKEQAKYHFISGYTAKVAGTEEGIVDPTVVFSACFGEPFMPLSPITYAKMLGERMEENNVNVWLVNTGWSGGKFGVGSRIKLKYTRALISAALSGKLEDVNFNEFPVFNLKYPESCPEVPSEILNPRNTWENKSEYDEVLNSLAHSFEENFIKYGEVSEKLKSGGPTFN